MNLFTQAYSTWVADRRVLSDREERGETVGEDWHASDDAAVELLHQAALLIGEGQPEVEFVWRIRMPGEPEEWVIPRSGDEYEQTADMLFFQLGDALDWRDDEVDIAVENEDADEVAYIATWVLCCLTTEALPTAEYERGRQARIEADFLAIGYVRGADHVWRSPEAT